MYGTFVFFYAFINLDGGVHVVNTLRTVFISEENTIREQRQVIIVARDHYKIAMKTIRLSNSPSAADRQSVSP